jgi:hypothetical protein
MSDPRSLQFNPQIVFRNLDVSTTAETLSEYLWQTLGLDVQPDYIVMATPSPTYTMAFVTLTRETLASFLTRYLEGQTFNGRALTVEAKKTMRQGGRIPRRVLPATAKINRPKVLEQK